VKKKGLGEGGQLAAIGNNGGGKSIKNFKSLTPKERSNMGVAVGGKGKCHEHSSLRR